MLNKNMLFKNLSFYKKRFNQDLKKTEKAFKAFKLNLKNFEIPFLKCYEKDYIFDFSSSTVKKFSKYKNIVVIGMGGSVLGTKSIYSFLKSKFDLIFCDPPFKDVNIEKLIQLIYNNNILQKNGIFVLHRHKNTKEKLPNYFKIIDEKIYGISKIMFGKFLS